MTFCQTKQLWWELEVKDDHSLFAAHVTRSSWHPVRTSGKLYPGSGSQLVSVTRVIRNFLNVNKLQQQWAAQQVGGSRPPSHSAPHWICLCFLWKWVVWINRCPPWPLNISTLLCQLVTGDSYCIKSFLIFLTAKVSSSTTYQINLSVCLSLSNHFQFR